MLCYKDMSFCTAQDCTNLECSRNTRRGDFNPDDFWSDKVCYGDFLSDCKNYTKEESNE